jgi:hypothetical protein
MAGMKNIMLRTRSVAMITLLVVSVVPSLFSPTAGAETLVELPRVLFKLGEEPVATQSLALSDANGDGRKDFIIGRVNETGALANTYVVFNGPTLPSIIDLNSLGSLGYKITTSAFTYPTAEVGRDVKNVGDVNGDGKEDILISTVALTDVNDQRAYLLYGKEDVNVIDVGNLQAVEGVKFKSHGMYLTPALLGDVNGDGYKDFGFGDFTWGENTNAPGGQVHVVFGRALWPLEIDLNNLAAPHGFQINGKAFSETGWSVSAAGDVNGDGLDDIALTSPVDVLVSHGNNTPPDVTSAIYVVFGGNNLNIQLANLGSAGFRIHSSTNYFYYGSNIRPVGDVNGDGLDDIIVRSTGGYASMPSDKAWTVFGKANTAEINLDNVGTYGATATFDNSISGHWSTMAKDTEAVRLGDSSEAGPNGEQGAGVVYGLPLNSLGSNQVIPSENLAYTIRGASSDMHLGAVMADDSTDGELLVSIGSGMLNYVAAVVPARNANIALSLREPQDQVAPTIGLPGWSQNPKPVAGATDLTVAANDGDGSGVARGEYFLGDSDPGQGNGATMNWDGTNLSTTFGTDFPTGVYKVSVRAQDNAGNWSDPVGDYLVVYNPDGPRMTGRRTIIPTLGNGDILPGLITSNQNDKAIFGFSVKYNSQGQIANNSDLQFKYKTGTHCNGSNPQNCHSLELNATSIAWLTTQGTNNSTGTFQGTASMTVDGQASVVSFRVTGIDGERLDGSSLDRFQIEIFAEGDNPNTATPLYKVNSADIARGNVKIIGGQTTPPPAS